MNFRNLAVVTILAIILLPITITAQQNKLNVINFYPVDESEYDWQVEDGGDEANSERETGYHLHLNGIFALNENMLFLYGCKSKNAAANRSVLLLSQNQGESWQEVMKPEYGSVVTRLFFTDQLNGWALVEWGVEGPAAVLLYGTNDGGRSWQQLSEVPKYNYLGMPISLEFKDALKGKIEMSYDDEPDETQLTILTTEDGGRSWKEQRKLPIANFSEPANSDQDTDTVASCKFNNQQWKITRVAELQTESSIDNYQIVTRKPVDKRWRAISRLPGYLP